jgi:hypothetical protein
MSLRVVNCRSRDWKRPSTTVRESACVGHRAASTRVDLVYKLRSPHRHTNADEGIGADRAMAMRARHVAVTAGFQLGILLCCLNCRVQPKADL